MPAVNLSADLKEQLENAAGTISNIDGPGVAGYCATLNQFVSVCVEVHIGLKLDGYKRYEDISSVNPNITMQFSPPPDLSCQSDDLHFDPNEDEIITINVSRRS